MTLNRGPSAFWAAMHRWRFLRSRMPFWRVVVESRFDRSVRRWPARFDGAVTAVFVWARTIEEAEGLASLAMQEEGLTPVTADAVKCPPAAAPSANPAAVSRGAHGYLARREDETSTPGPSRRDARA